MRLLPILESQGKMACDMLIILLGTTVLVKLLAPETFLIRSLVNQGKHPRQDSHLRHPI